MEIVSVVDIFLMYKKFVLKSFPSNNFPEDLSCFDLVEKKREDLTIEDG